jgi:hypothetical protein
MKYSIIAIPALIVFFILSLLIIGRIEQKLGIVELEQKRISDLNPTLQEVLYVTKKILKNTSKKDNVC